MGMKNNQHSRVPIHILQSAPNRWYFKYQTVQICCNIVSRYIISPEKLYTSLHVKNEQKKAQNKDDKSTKWRVPKNKIKTILVRKEKIFALIRLELATKHTNIHNIHIFRIWQNFTGFQQMLLDHSASRFLQN